jgi:diguanylate cyclase (GGDEF)-like protein
MIDIDHFKPYNDRNGHYAGDALLRATAEAWRDELRAIDLLARIGGDEFALALPDCTIERATEVVDRLRGVMPDSHSFSAGLAAWSGESEDELMIRADMALYAAKSAGRSRTVSAENAGEPAPR